jgi:hypothetical protein
MLPAVAQSARTVPSIITRDQSIWAGRFLLAELVVREDFFAGAVELRFLDMRKGRQ